MRALVSVGLVISSAASQVPLSWQLLGPATSPPARCDHAMAYDSARQRTVLFGGLNAGFASLQDIWEWDGSTWTQVTPATSPPARSAHAMAYDAARQRTVLFGGLDAANNYLGDTWVWDGTTWSQATPTSSPSARWSSALAYDVMRQRTVLFGGFASGATNGLSDTWEWNGNNWQQSAPATQPPRRNGHSMVYDSMGQRVILFGGWIGGYANDTWSWNGVTWTQFASLTAPAARGFVAAAWHPMHGLVLHGGCDLPTGLPRVYYTDTWQFMNNSWGLVGAPGPSMRYRHAMVYDQARGQCVVFGGLLGVTPPATATYNDTWVTLPVTPASFLPGGPGCAGSNGIPLLTAAPGLLPQIGATFQAHLSHLPLVATVVIPCHGFAQQVPVDLASIGMPGCLLHVNPAISSFGVAVTGQFTYQAFTVPNSPGLVGLSVVLQALVVDAQAGNPMGATVSSAGIATIGW